MQKVKPLKKFGQNYLVDNNILLKIINEILPKEGDNIIEIGPGTGALTKMILERTGELTAVEIDKRVIEQLKDAYPKLELVNEDFLKLDLSKFFFNKRKKVRIVGNIPYNLTSPILFKLIEFRDIVDDSVLMVQYEVAKRMTAVKGTKDYGILAVLLKYFTEVKFCFKVSPNVFYPKPKVFSAVVHIFLRESKLDTAEKDFFIKIVKAAFGNRRKTLKNSLSNSIFRSLKFTDSGIDLSLRAEQLDVNDFVILANYARDKFNKSGFVL